MYKNKPYLSLVLLFAALCSIVACKKNLEEGSIKPSLGATAVSAGGGQTVTITGSNLLANGQTPVITLNGKLLTIIKAWNDSVKVTIPKLAGSGKIMISVDGKTYEGPECTYKYKATVTTIAGTGGVGTGDGPGNSAAFNCPWGITADVNGDLYVADCYNRLIRKIAAETNTVSTISIPTFIQGNKNFYSPYNITLDKAKHDLYVTDFNKHLMKIAADGSMSLLYDGTATTTGIALGPDGFLYMTNNIKGTILKLTTTGDSTASFAPGIITPRNIIFDSANNMFVAGYDGASASAAIFQFDYITGKSKLIFTDKAFQGWEIAVDAMGNFYEADHFGNTLKLIEKNGNVVTLAGSGNAADVDGVNLDASFDGPQGLTINGNGNLYLTTYNYDRKTGNKVRKIVVE